MTETTETATPAGVGNGSRPAAPSRPRTRTPQPSAPPGTTVVLLATAVTDDGTPAAAQPWEDQTLVTRLVEQYRWLGAREIHLVTRPAFADELRALAGDSVRITASPSLADDMRAVAKVARGADGALVVGLADILTHHQALAGLLADPRTSTGILATAARLGRPFAFKTRSNRGRVVSASSAYHVAHKANHRFLGVLRVAPAQHDDLIRAAERLAELTHGDLLPGWEEELDAKATRWRMRIAQWRQDPEALDEDLPDEVEPDVDPLAPESPDAVALPPEDEAELRRRRAAAEQDATALLLVGLIRSGVHVGNSFVRKLYWSRPMSEAGLARARERMDHYDEDKALLNSAVKAADGFFTSFFVSPYSKYIARWAARRGFTPNQITTVSLFIGLAAAAAFATGERPGLIAGAILLQLAFTTDCVDGQLARYTRTFSKLGAWLDSIFDRSKEYLVFAGLAIGAERAGDPVWVLAAAALTLQTVRHMMDFSFAAAAHQVLGAAPQQPLEDPSDRPRRNSQPASPQPAEEDRPERQPFSLRRLPRIVLGSWRKLDRLPGALWVKRIVAFPIGERFAAISITAAVSSARTTFVVLLAWGTFAACYSTAGRLLRSIR